MDSKTLKKNNIKTRGSESKLKDLVNQETQSDKVVDKNIEDICDENLTTLQKIHAILLNCVNLSKKQKLEFCESERYFMKLYLKELRKQNESS
jgi:hypothetical protein